VEEARRVLDRAIEGSAKKKDIRLIIEKTRMDWLETTDSKKSAAAMWVLLEKYRDDPVLHSWAMWYFLSLGDASTALRLNKGATDPDGAYYSGLEKAFAGDLDRAEELFLSVANNDGNAWCALANVALIRERKNDFAGAAEKFTLAAKLSPDARRASRLQYEAARVLAQSCHDVRGALDLLRYALQLDPSNYRAVSMLRNLEAAK
jgi:tetratricopeptide (TPR) repeat protein